MSSKAVQPVVLPTPLSFADRGGQSFSFDHDGAVDSFAELLVQSRVDPADFRPQLEEHESASGRPSKR
jgi:hypothetical protein